MCRQISPLQGKKNDQLIGIFHFSSTHQTRMSTVKNSFTRKYFNNHNSESQSFVILSLFSTYSIKRHQFQFQFHSVLSSFAISNDSSFIHYTHERNLCVEEWILKIIYILKAVANRYSKKRKNMCAIRFVTTDSKEWERKKKNLYLC